MRWVEAGGGVAGGGGGGCSRGGGGEAEGGGGGENGWGWCAVKVLLVEVCGAGGG